MDTWRHRITIHTAADVLGLLPEPVDEVPPSMFCDDEGVCYFSAGSNPLTQAIERLLDQVGDEGWELVQVLFRPGQMIGFWKQPR
jgi:UDP:flavonoid glycosyltransferase YjiC (YdhE family)